MISKMIKYLLNFDLEVFNKWKLSKILLLMGIVASFVWAGYFAYVILLVPHQITYLEGAANVQTWFFLKGENPFTLEHHPIGTNNYGVLYSIIVLPFAALFGNSLLAHRAVTLGFTILAALTGFFAIHRTKKDILLAAACSVFITISLMGMQGMGGISAYPSATGTFFFMTAILLPFICSFDEKSLFFSILASMAAFYTKPYFLLSFGIVASYIFLFVSIKKGLLYGLSSFIIFLISALIVKYIFPMYFIDVIWGNVFNTYKRLNHMLDQVRGLIISFLPLLISVFLILAAENSNRQKAEDQMKYFALNRPTWAAPLWGRSPNYLFYALVISSAAFILVLGWHALNQFGYAYQLIMPLFFCWFFGEIIFTDKAKLFIVLMILINLFTWERSALSPEFLRERSRNEWTELLGYMQDAKSILHPPLIAADVISLGLPPIDSGHTILFYNILPYPNTILADIPYEKIRRDGYGFTTAINHRLENQKYDLVITIKDKAAFFDYWILQQHYTLVSELNIEMNMGGNYTVQVWEPSP